MSNTKKSYLLFKIDDLKKCSIEKVKESPMSIRIRGEILLLFRKWTKRNKSKIKNRLKMIERNTSISEDIGLGSYSRLKVMKKISEDGIENSYKMIRNKRVFFEGF